MLSAFSFSVGTLPEGIAVVVHSLIQMSYGKLASSAVLLIAISVFDRIPLFKAPWTPTWDRQAIL